MILGTLYCCVAAFALDLETKHLAIVCISVSLSMPVGPEAVHLIHDQPVFQPQDTPSLETGKSWLSEMINAMVVLRYGRAYTPFCFPALSSVECSARLLFTSLPEQHVHHRVALAQFVSFHEANVHSIMNF